MDKEKKKSGSGDIMENIKDRFCTCPLCKKELNDPRRLPCAHRYCLDCISKEIRDFYAKNKGNMFPCPNCQQKTPIPKGGASDLKQDIWVTEMMGLSELREKLTSEIKSGICGCCDKDGGELVAYCTDCDGFVCQNCCALHETLAVLKTHGNIFKLDNAMKQNKWKIDLKKLVSIIPAPKCKTHKKMELELCCRTCENSLICLKCALVKHAEHDKDEVEDVVKSMREELQRERIDVATRKNTSLACRKQNEQTQKKMDVTFEKIVAGIENKYKLGVEKCDEEEEYLTAEDTDAIETIESSRDFDVMSYQKKAEENIEMIKREMQKRIEKINEELTMNVKNRKDHSQRQIDVIEARMNEKKKDINAVRDQLAVDKGKLLHVVATCKKAATATLNDCNKNIDEVLIRLQYVNENADAVVGVSTEWSFVETAADLMMTMSNFKKSLDETQFQAKMLSTPMVAFEPTEDPFKIGQLQNTVSRQFQVVSAGRFSKEEWKIDDVISIANGTLAVAGMSISKESAIDFITHDGKTTREKDFLFEDALPWCLSRAGDNRLLAGRGSDIDVFNVATGESSRKANVKRVPRWRPDDKIITTAYDGNMNEIMVCREKSNEVFVFDRDLNFVRGFKMPGPGKGPFSMIVSGDHLFVCNVLREGFAISIDLGTTNIISRFHPIENTHQALDICCDSQRNVFILWKRERDVCVVQYRSNGQPILGLPVHPGAALATVARSKDGSEDMVIGTYDGRLAFYRLPLRRVAQRDNQPSWFDGIDDITLEKYLSRRFHWQSTTQKYGMRGTFDFDLKHLSNPVPAPSGMSPNQSMNMSHNMSGNMSGNAGDTSLFV